MRWNYKCQACWYMFRLSLISVSTVRPLTSHGESTQCTGLSLGLTHPFLTALPRNLHLPWHGTVRSGQHYIQVASWQTADLSVPTHTLILAAGKEDLAVLVDWTVQHTDLSFMSWGKGMKNNQSQMFGFNVTETSCAVWTTHTPAQTPVLLCTSAL